MNENFLLINNSENNMLQFEQRRNWKFLGHCEILYVDGTFRNFPKSFYQLFILHGVENSNITQLLLKYFYFLFKYTPQLLRLLAFLNYYILKFFTNNFDSNTWKLIFFIIIFVIWSNICVIFSRIGSYLWGS